MKLDPSTIHAVHLQCFLKSLSNHSGYAKGDCYFIREFVSVKIKNYPTSIFHWCEYCSNVNIFSQTADLKTYLLGRRNLVNEKSRNDDDEVSNKRLTSMALDIARGLAYLAEMKYVHR